MLRFFGLLDFADFALSKFGKPNGTVRTGRDAGGFSSSRRHREFQQCPVGCDAPDLTTADLSEPNRSVGAKHRLVWVAPFPC